MTHVIIVQSITQPVSILPLTRGGGFENFEELVGNFIGDVGSGFFLPNLFHPVMDALEHLDLIPNSLGSDNTAASTDNYEAFVLRL